MIRWDLFVTLMLASAAWGFLALGVGYVAGLVVNVLRKHRAQRTIQALRQKLPPPEGVPMPCMHCPVCWRAVGDVPAAPRRCLNGGTLCDACAQASHDAHRVFITKPPS